MKAFVNNIVSDVSTHGLIGKHHEHQHIKGATAGLQNRLVAAQEKDMPKCKNKIKLIHILYMC